jgi:hypothetical protein
VNLNNGAVAIVEVDFGSDPAFHFCMFYAGRNWSQHSKHTKLFIQNLSCPFNSFAPIKGIMDNKKPFALLLVSGFTDAIALWFAYWWEIDCKQMFIRIVSGVDVIYFFGVDHKKRPSMRTMRAKVWIS